MSETGIIINYELEEETKEEEEEEDEDWEFSFEAADNSATTNSVVVPIHPEKEEEPKEEDSTPLSPPPKPNRKPPSLPPTEGQQNNNAPTEDQQLENAETNEDKANEDTDSIDETLPAPAFERPPVPTKPKPNLMGAKSVLAEEFKEQVAQFSSDNEDSPSTPSTPSSANSVVRPPVPKRYAIEAESKSEIKTTVAKGKFEQSRDGFKAVDYTYVYTGDIVTIHPHAEVKKKTVGVVRYVGNVSENELLVGIECFEPQKGGCDGIYGGEKCFDVKYKGSGFFVKPIHVRKYEPVVEQLKGQNYEKIGYMIKMGRGNLKNWKKRWFILTLDYLHYFENPFSEKELGRVSVANCTIEEFTSDKPFCFALKSSTDKELVCSCETDQAKQDWMKVLLSTGAIATERQSKQNALARAIMRGDRKSVV